MIRLAINIELLLPKQAAQTAINAVSDIQIVCDLGIFLNQQDMNFKLFVGEGGTW